MCTRTAKERKDPWSKGEERFHVAARGPAGVKHLGPAVGLVGLAACSDNHSRSQDEPGKAAKAVPGDPIPAQEQKHVRASLLSADRGGRAPGPAEELPPAQSPREEAEPCRTPGVLRPAGVVTAMGAWGAAVIAWLVLQGQMR